MLRSTFVHIPGIGLRREQAIWAAGITTWEHALDYQYCASRVSSRQADTLRRQIMRSMSALEARNLSMFKKLIRIGEGWRVYPELRDEALYLDIETTGLWARDEITIIGAYSGNHFQSFIAGKNLNDFPRYAAQFKFVVTFNGSCFDFPVLRRQFPSLRFPFHLDLRYAAKRCDLVGGLKEIERTLQVKRPARLRGLDGWDAVLLWAKYRKGDRSALSKLLKYNECDVRNLETIANLICNRLSGIGTTRASVTRNRIDGVKAFIRAARARLFG